MEELLFVEKDAIPNENVIIAALRESYSLYRMIHEKIEVKRPNIQTEWKYYGKKNGWLLKHLDAKRNIVFLAIYDGFFKLSFTFGDNVVAQILSSDHIREDVKKQIRESKRYAEGTTILFSVKSENDAEQAMELIEYKLG